MSQLTLKHETYNLGRGLGELYTRGEFVDVTLACQGEQVQAHRAVLAASSLQFRALLKLQPWQHPIVVLQDAELTQVKALVDFMYHGEVTVDQNDVVGFLKLAEALQVIGLMKDKEKVREVIDVHDEEIFNGAPGTYKRPHTPTPQPAKIARFGNDRDVSAHNTGSEEMPSSPVASTSQEEQWLPSIYNAGTVDQQSWVPEDELPMQPWTIPDAPKVEVSQEPSLQLVPLLGVEDDIKIEEEELRDITDNQEETTGGENAEGVENYTQQLDDDTQRPDESYVGEAPLASGATSTSLSTTLKQPSTTKSNPSIAPSSCKVSVTKGVVNGDSHINQQASCTEAKSKNPLSPSRAAQSNSGPSIKINVQNVVKANVPVPPSQGEPLPSQSKSVKSAVTPSSVTTKSRGRPKIKHSSKPTTSMEEEVMTCPPTALQGNDLNHTVSEQAATTSQPSTSQASTSQASSQPRFSSRGRPLKPRVTEPLESNFEDDSDSYSDSESYGEYGEDEDNTTQDDRRDVSVQSHINKTSQPSDFTFTCDICTKSYKKKGDLNRHYKVKHPTIGRLPCIFCKAMFSDSQDLEQHKLNLHANEFYQQACSVCGKKFTQKSHLKQHLKLVHHQNIELQLSSKTDCYFCFQKFNFCIEKSEHLQKVHPELCFKCRLCPKVFSARLFRYGHEMKCHGQNIDNPEQCFPCSLCKMALSSQARLNKHMKSFHNK